MTNKETQDDLNLYLNEKIDKTPLEKILKIFTETPTEKRFQLLRDLTSWHAETLRQYLNFEREEVEKSNKNISDWQDQLSSLKKILPPTVVKPIN